MTPHVAVLISGRGSNMQSLLAAFPDRIAVVLSNNPDAIGLTLTDGIPAICVDHRPFRRDRAAHEAAIAETLDRHHVDTICLAGYMRILTSLLVNRYAGRMLNIHPSLLPAFPGLNTHARALAAGVKLHGCTVHRVTETMDEGPILAQAAIPVLPGDTADTLAARVLAEEHLLYPLALRLFLDGKPGRAATGHLRNPLPPDCPGA